jgi:methyl-accepting chemotaxis protein
MPFLNGFALRLTHKITAIGIVGVAGVVLVGGMHMYSETAVAPYREAAENARTIFDLNSKIEIELLEGRRAEKDFLLRNDQQLADAATKIGKAVISDIDVLHGKVVAIGKADLARQIEAMGGSLKQYQMHFASVVEEKVRLGLDEKSGLEGRLRDSVHDIEARLAQLHQSALAAPMLMLRRHEKDFMLRRDAKYGDEMKKQASEFIAEVEKTDIPEAAKAEIRQKLAEYQREFFAWFDTALKLGGETKAMSEAFSAIFVRL